jgi:hypothetical protein
LAVVVVIRRPYGVLIVAPWRSPVERDNNIDTGHKKSSQKEIVVQGKCAKRR